MRPGPKRPRNRRRPITRRSIWGRPGSAAGHSGRPTPISRRRPADRSPCFRSRITLGIETALEAHLAFRLVSRLRAEVTGTWGQAELRARVTGDLEGAAPVTVTNRLRMVTVQGAGIWYFKRRGKWEPFLRGGAGWMRQLTADYALAGDGTIANAGIGVKYWWFERNRGLLERVGLRSDARVVGRFGGLEVGTTTRLITPAVSVAAIIGF